MTRWFAILVFFGFSSAQADEIRVAVAANFYSTVKSLKTQFEEQSEHKLVLISGSTGKLYAQIINGAPYDVYLAADAQRPEQLWQNGIGQKPFVYAIGRLALWSPNARDPWNKLKTSEFRQIAIANPRLAPYGEAAADTLRKLGLWQATQEHLIFGENVAQTYQFVDIGKVDMGFVALSQVLHQNQDHYVQVDPKLHTAIEQHGLPLTSGQATREFVDFLRTPATQAIIQSQGFYTPNVESR